MPAFPITRAYEFGFLASDLKNFLANLSQSTSKWLLAGADLSNVQAAWLLQKFGIVFEVLLWRLVLRIKRRIITDIPVFGTLAVLVADEGVSLLKIVNNALLDGWW